jgi:RecB family exonuclease
VITPRRTRLVRVPNLQAFRRAVRVLVAEAGVAPAAVIVPTSGAADQVRRSLPAGLASVPHGSPALLVTREQLYDDLHARLPRPPRRLTPFERDAVAQAAAAAAAASMASSLPFQIRPGLVAEVLRFYDHLRRQAQPVRRFEELLSQALEASAEAGDRGAERMLQQTRFLAGTFREYERRVAACGAWDEHLLRERLQVETPERPLRRVIAAVADWIGDPDGLFVADFDLLARLPALESFDIVSTETMLGSGFHERLHRWLPGIEEVVSADSAGLAETSRPTLLVPPPAGTSEPDQLWYTHRDREEELTSVIRRVIEDRDEAGPDGWLGRAALDRVAVVFKQPLPYLYIAPETFGAADVPYQVSDALPLAAEPSVAALDLVLTAVENGFARDALMALLRSSHFEFDRAGAALSRESIRALDQALSQARYLGDLNRLERLAVEREAGQVSPALLTALKIGRELAPLADAAPASEQIRRLQAFLTTYWAGPDAGDSFAGREGRARAAVDDVLTRLGEAHAAHHDPTWRIEDLASAIRRWIQHETFRRNVTPADGVHLLDDRAAPYGDFDDVTLVGLVENEWPERQRRNIFYPPGLLNVLGWPSEHDSRAAADARFLDLLGSASRSVCLSVFAMDEDAIVSRSIQLDLVPRARLATSIVQVDAEGPVLIGDVLAAGAVPATLGDAARAWAQLRAQRSGADAPEFHGRVGPQATRAWTVTALETYLGCPFKFFAQHVLRLAEDPDDEETPDPRRQGRFVHEVFEAFFARWQRSGMGAIHAGNLIEARRMFEEVVEGALKSLPNDGEAALERTRLLGSSAAAGLGEAVMRMEAERPAPIVERLLEYRLEGTFAIETGSGVRRVSLRGKADRIDLMADGTFRLIDYKLGWPPNRRTALQLPIYGVCAEQQLARERGRPWKLGEAAYLAFKGPKRVVPLYSTAAERDETLAAAQRRLAETLDSIEDGRFPPAPDDVFRCETCAFAAVCRKDYVAS